MLIRDYPLVAAGLGMEHKGQCTLSTLHIKVTGKRPLRDFISVYFSSTRLQRIRRLIGIMKQARIIVRFTDEG
jgi:hypothetical protein